MQFKSKIFRGACLAALTAGLITLNSCQKFLQVSNPPNEVLLTEAFQDSATSSAAVTSIYSQMLTNQGCEWGGLSFNTSTNADDVDVPGGSLYSFVNILYLYDPSFGFYGQMWTNPYKTIVQANSCIEGLQAPNGLSTSLRNQLLGEALFCRAWEYFYLVNNFGDYMPLLLTSDLAKTMLASPSPKAATYAQIVKDLTAAESLLVAAYPSPGPVRPNLYAAKALHARVALYTRDYGTAVSMASDVINSGLYTPLPAPATAFLKDSKEAIWSLMPNNTAGPTNGLGATPDGNKYAYTSGTPNFILTDFLVSAFEAGDQRLANWGKQVVDDGTTYYVPYKYKDPGSINNTIKEFYIILRAGEQYLIRAEANVMLGNIGNAVTDLDVVRTRAGLPGLSTSMNQADAMAAVRHERQVELFSEWGHRRYDLIRWPGLVNPSGTLADEVFAAEKGDFWSPYCKLYPIPLTELQADKNLKQIPLQ